MEIQFPFRLFSRREERIALFDGSFPEERKKPEYPEKNLYPSPPTYPSPKLSFCPK